MKRLKTLGALAASLPLLMGQSAVAAGLDNFIYENKLELASAGDFDGDGRMDVVLVDRASGKYRTGYQLTPGKITWSAVRMSGIPNITSISVGKVLDLKRDAIAFTSADGANINIIDASSASLPGKTVSITPNCLGPASVVAIDIGGNGNTPELDICIGSIYNTDPATLSTLMRSKGGKFEQLDEVEAPGQFNHAQRLALKEGGLEYLCAIMPGKGKDSLIVQNLSGAKPQTVFQGEDLPAGAFVAAGNFRGQPLRDFLFYKFDDKEFQFRPVEESAGKLSLGKGAAFTFDKAITEIFAIGQSILVVHGTNDPAVLYAFDGTKAPSVVQTFPPKSGEMISGALVFGDRLGMLYRPSRSRMKYSARFECFKPDGGKYVSTGSEELSSLDVGDVFVIPDIARMINEKTQEKTAADMKAYDTIIPGTTVKFTMLPIPAGEFSMGTPETEKGRKPDESPIHKVKIAPFWMGKYEVTWSEYELFMYPDDEKKLRAINKSDPNVDKVSDSVTRPSKPYVEMSFGMGKDGFPAIAMTQHGANKYCMWLSAKTGQYFRLPTEAEWEYACRAGTTTAYSFGDDESKLGEYAWFEKNSEENGDWKYHKIGTKKPNPWGLFDMHGNVAEWCLDAYTPDYSAHAAGADNPWTKATKPYPHAARGGSYDFEASLCRSGARLSSTPDWKAQDPQLPKSYWYLTDAKFIGFRLVRPLKVPSAEEMQKSWISGVEKD